MKRCIVSYFCLLILAAFALADAAHAQKPRVPFKKPMADILVSGVSIKPDPPRAQKDMITIEVTVKNAGNAALPKVCSLAMDLYNQDTKPDYRNRIIPWYANNIPTLAPGAEAKISKTITIPYPGTYKLSLIIITEGLQIGDENPQNNRHELIFEAKRPPVPVDLVLDSVAIGPDRRIVLRMHNAGGAIPDPDFSTSYVRVRVSGVERPLERNLHMKEIDPGGILKRGQDSPLGGGLPFGSTTRYLNFSWPSTGFDAINLDAGHTYTFTVEVILDYNHRISETNKENNRRTVTLTYNP